MEQNKNKFRKSIIRKLISVWTWATRYNDGRGHYPPMRFIVACAAGNLQRALEKSCTKGYTEEQLCEFDADIYGWQ